MCRCISASVAAAALALAVAAAQGARVETMEGKRHAGEARIEGDTLVIAWNQREARVPLSALKHADLSKEPAEKKPVDALFGKLPAPWKLAGVGKFTRGGDAKWRRDGTFRIETSSRPDRRDFSGFHMAWQRIPENCEIVARVVEIENREWDGKAGVIFRDGLGDKDRNVLLTVNSHGRAAMRNWKHKGGTTREDKSRRYPPPAWLRLVRENEVITGMVSEDGRYWREIWSASKDKTKDALLFGLAATVTEGEEKRYTALFDNVHVGPVGSHRGDWGKQLVHLVDGTVLAAQLESLGTAAVSLGGDWKHVRISTVQVARIDFFHPIPEELAQPLEAGRHGVLLRSGDFAEGALESIEGDALVMTSVLFGRKTYDLKREIDVLSLRPRAPPTKNALTVHLEDGSRLVATSLVGENGRVRIGTKFAGDVEVAFEKIEKIARDLP